MHFREVNKELKRLKANIYWCEEALNGVDGSNPFYNSLWRDYQQAVNALKDFRNTTLKGLSSCTV